MKATSETWNSFWKLLFIPTTMVKKSNLQWFNEKILVLLIAIHIQNVASFWGEENFVKKNWAEENFSKKGLPTNTLTSAYTRFIKIPNCITESWMIRTIEVRSVTDLASGLCSVVASPSNIMLKCHFRVLWRLRIVVLRVCWCLLDSHVGTGWKTSQHNSFLFFFGLKNLVRKH